MSADPIADLDVLAAGSDAAQPRGAPLAVAGLLPPAGCAAVFAAGTGGWRRPVRYTEVTVAMASAMAPVVPAVAAAVLAVAVLGGCASQSAARLPARSAPPSAPPVTPAAASGSAEAAVIASYTRYFPVLTAAEAAGGSRAEAMLAPYAAQPYLGHVLSQMAVYRAQHEVSVGYLVPHVMQVTVKGAQATVRDCQDASHAALADSRTGHVIAGTRGSARTYLIATLARGSDGRWRLTSLAHVAVPCQPVPSPS